MKRESVEIHRRKSFSKKERARLFELYGGVCYLSGAKIGPLDEWEIEHVLALALGGTNDDENLRLALRDPHRDKTRRDVKAIGKVMRLEKKADPFTRKPSKMQSRGFDKTHTKKFNGTVVLRRER